jgi:CBS domain-containing protein
MLLCPYCGSENIDGTDDCEQCGQPLVESHLAPPKYEVERSLLNDRINVLAPNRAISVPPTTSVVDVLRLMADKGIGCVVVAEAGRPVGIFSERDALLKIGADAAQVAARPVRDFMTPKPETLVADAKLAYAVQRMDLGGYRHLPIVDSQGAVTGIVSARDILRHLMESLKRG